MEASHALEHLPGLLPGGSVAAWTDPGEPSGAIAHSGSTEPLPVFSATKMFIAAGVLRALDAGKLDLSDSLASRLAGAPAGCTIREVLHHTAGLGNYTADPGYLRAVAEAPGEPWALERITEASAPGAPGRFTYSNTGYWYLGAILEQVSGMALGQYLHREVFEPAGMMETRYPELETSLTPAGYSTLWAGPAGAAFSTPADLLRFQQFVRGPGPSVSRPLGAAATREFFTTVPVPRQSPWKSPHYGAGVMVDPALALWGHGGSGPGYRSAVFGRFDTVSAAAVICPASGTFVPEDVLVEVLGHRETRGPEPAPDGRLEGAPGQPTRETYGNGTEQGRPLPVREPDRRIRAWLDGWEGHFLQGPGRGDG